MARGGQRLYYAGAASKIYEQPKRLERLGYLRSEQRPGKTKERTYYTLTTKRVAALREWLARPSSFPRIESEAVARVLASDLAEDERVVAESLQALRQEIAELATGIDEDERRASLIPHRARQLKLVRSLGKRLLQTHLDWVDEVERETQEPTEGAGTQAPIIAILPTTTGGTDTARCPASCLTLLCAEATVQVGAAQESDRGSAFTPETAPIDQAHRIPGARSRSHWGADPSSVKRLRRSPFDKRTTRHGYETGTSAWARAGKPGHSRHSVKGRLW